MELIFERSRPGRGTDLLPPLDVPECPVPEEFARLAADWQGGRIGSRDAARRLGISQDTFLRWAHGR